MSLVALATSGDQDLLIPQPAVSVPDSGATVTLFGLAMIAVAGFRRKFHTC
jgi:hypothetical protein